MSGGYQIAVIALALVVAALTVVPLELQRRLVNDVLAGSDHQLLVQLALVYAAVVLVQASLKLTLRLSQAWLGESATAYTRRHLLGLLNDHTIEQRSGETTAVLGSEVDKLGGFVGEGPSNAAASLGVLLAVGTYMVVTSPSLALVSFCILLPQTLLVLLAQRKINVLARFRVMLMRRWARRLERPDDHLLRPGILALYRNRLRATAWKHGSKVASNAIGLLGPLLILVIGGFAVMAGETEVGTLVAFISGFERMSAPARELFAHFRFLEQSRIQHAMIARWMQ